MRASNLLRIDRLIAALCVALMFVYAATIPDEVAAQIKHSSGQRISHVHVNADHASHEAASDIHADHDDSALNGESAPGDHPVSGHHHHGDTGTNLFLANAATTAVVATSDGLRAIGQDRLIRGLKPARAERPPRATTLNA